MKQRFMHFPERFTTFLDTLLILMSIKQNHYQLVPRKGVLLEKSAVVQLVKEHPIFYRCQSSLPSVQETGTGHYPQSCALKPQFQAFFSVHFNVTFAYKFILVKLIMPKISNGIISGCFVESRYHKVFEIEVNTYFYLGYV